MKTCEKCGKIIDENNFFGSGRFCSRSCSNSHIKTKEQRENISIGLLKETICQCMFCGKTFYTLAKRARHERDCVNNPNRKIIGKKVLAKKIQKLNQPVKMKDQDTNSIIELDITQNELQNYRLNHPVCEICGKAVNEISKQNSKIKISKLCIDHSHVTNKFRGLLCPVCNRELGWYEKNKTAIQRYLDKSGGNKN